MSSEHFLEGFLLFVLELLLTLPQFCKLARNCSIIRHQFTRFDKIFLGLLILLENDLRESTAIEGLSWKEVT